MQGVRAQSALVSESRSSRNSGNAGIYLHALYKWGMIMNVRSSSATHFVKAVGSAAVSLHLMRGQCQLFSLAAAFAAAAVIAAASIASL